MNEHTHTNPPQDETILVLGGTGKTGRRIVSRLHALGRNVRIGSRSGTPPFLWEDATTWAPVLQDITSVYISYTPDLAAPGAPEKIRKLVDLSKTMGIRKLVLLSGRGEEEAQRCEQIVRTSGIASTIVRCGWFNQNFSENFIRDMVLDGVVALPVTTVAEPFVDTDDIADVAVAALIDDRHVGQLYELTGPELITFPQAVAEIAKATGRPIHYQPITREQFVNGLLGQQLPAELVSLLDYLFTTVLDGRNSYLCDGVERALGRKPESFASYCRKVVQAGHWNHVPSNTPSQAPAVS
ncbi:MAG: NmrA family NAD(P)-binding protein [Verrucomicrobiota bacterium]